jgi:hypothetical protein
VDVAIIDAPAFVMGLEIAAAGERGHALLKRDRGRQANRARGMCGFPAVLDGGPIGGNLLGHKKTDISGTELGEIKCG